MKNSNFLRSGIVAFMFSLVLLNCRQDTPGDPDAIRNSDEFIAFKTAVLQERSEYEDKDFYLKMAQANGYSAAQLTEIAQEQARVSKAVLDLPAQGVAVLDSEGKYTPEFRQKARDIFSKSALPEAIKQQLYAKTLNIHMPSENTRALFNALAAKYPAILKDEKWRRELIAETGYSGI